MFKVDVAYAMPDQQVILTVEVEKEMTIEAVIMRSGILTLFPAIDLTCQKVGIFGKQKKLSDSVKAGDRIEIYRPLTLDPKEARRAKELKLKKRKT